MSGCCVNGCSNRNSKPGLKFYRIPTGSRPFQSHRRRLWLEAIKREDWTEDIIKNARICGAHFISGEMSLDWQSPDFVPSIFVNTKQSQRPKAKKKRQQLQTSPCETAEELGESSMEQCNELEAEPNRQRMDEEKQQECRLCSLRLQEITNLQEENKKLKEELSRKNLNEDFLKDNDAVVKFYTGLPSFALLMGVFMQIHPSLSNIDLKISHFQMLFLTLMRLRLNLPLDHVAHLFDISRTTASTLFNNTIKALYTHMSHLVSWPRQNVEMRADRAIEIDCFELFIEKARHARANAEIYPSSKNCNIMKYLLGITPQGTISYISKGWGGRSTDKRIAENSGFLQTLSRGDTVLADQRFNIKESVVQMGATLKTLAFPQGCSQLDVEETQKTHAKRVIWCMRLKYTMLNDTISLGLVVPCEDEDMTLLDKLVAVTCALTNLCPKAFRNSS